MGLDKLTQRECEIAALVADGLTDAEIAKRLFISRRTAEWHVEQILAKLGVRARSQIAAEVARSEAAAAARSTRNDVRHNLPRQLSELIGRTQDLLEVGRLLDKTRLLTLTGVPGVGKTRLALEVAMGCVGAYRDGAWFMDLAALKQEAVVTRAVADVLGIRDQQGSTLEQSLVGELQRRHVLLIFDNCEHVIDAVARLVELILRSTAETRVLATSREPLRLPGELNWRVSPLDLPRAGEEVTPEVIGRYSAIRLYAERAASAAPSFRITPANAVAVSDLCAQLDGVPLALELAAARAELMSPKEMLEHVRRHARLLAAGTRTAPERQRSMDAAINWSYGLLTDQEQALFRRLSVFAGTFSLESAEAVCASPDKDGSAIAPLLGALIEKSLITADQRPAGRTRYRLLEVIRYYAARRLDESDEAEQIKRRHLSHFLEMAEREAPLLFVDPRAPLQRLDAERDNLRLALQWAAENDSELELRLALSLWPYWNSHSHLAEGRSALEHALATDAGDPALRGAAIARAGQFAWYSGDYRAAERYARESIKLLRSVQGGAAGLTVGLWLLGVCMLKRRAFKEAIPLFEESVKAAAATGQHLFPLPALSALYVIKMQTGDVANARHMAANLLVEFSEARYPLQHCIATSAIAIEEANLGDWDRVVEALKVSLRVAQEYRFWYWGGVAVRAAAYLAAATRNHEECLRLVGASQMLRGGVPYSSWTTSKAEQLLERARAALSTEATRALIAEGEKMTPDSAFAMAVSQLQTAQTLMAVGRDGDRR